MPRGQDASFPGTCCPVTWPPGTWYLAVWSNTSSRARASGQSGPLFLGWGEHPKSSKNMIFGVKLPESQNVTKVYYLLYLHHVGMPPKSSKNQHFCIQNRYFRRLSAHLGFLDCQNAHTELPRSQDAGFPGILVPSYLASRYLVSGLVENYLPAREAIWTIWSPFPPFP